MNQLEARAPWSGRFPVSEPGPVRIVAGDGLTTPKILAAIEVAQ